MSRNIQNQIANAQKQLQELSSNEEMTLEEKMKKRQEFCSNDKSPIYFLATLSIFFKPIPCPPLFFVVYGNPSVGLMGSFPSKLLLIISIKILFLRNGEQDFFICEMAFKIFLKEDRYNEN